MAPRARCPASTWARSVAVQALVWSALLAASGDAAARAEPGEPEKPGPGKGSCSLRPQEPGGHNDCWSEADDSEADLLRVSMLQSALSIRARRPGEGLRRSDGDPRGHVVVQALGQVSADPAGEAQGGVAAERGVPAAPLGGQDGGEALAGAAPFQTEPVALSANALGNNDTVIAVHADEEPWQSQTPLELLTAGIANCSFLQTELPGAKHAVSITPLSLRVQLDLLRLIGAFPPRTPLLPPADPELNLMQTPAATSVDAERIHPSYLLSEHGLNQYLVVLLYAVFYLTCILTMYCWLANLPSHQGHKGAELCAPKRASMADIDVEEEVWRRGWLRWLSVSWADPFIAQWGHSADASHTKIKPHELPQIGNRDVQACQAANTLEQWWNEEVEREGMDNASLLRVCLRSWGFWTLTRMWALTMGQMLLCGVYPVFVIDRAMNYFYWLQQDTTLHGGTPDLAKPILISIVAFMVGPAANIMLSTTTTSVSCRLDQQLCSGLSVALFRKCQRLPSATPNTSAGDAEPNAELNLDLMNLMNYDVNTCAVGAYQMILVFITSITSLVVLTLLLWTKLHLGTLCAIGVGIPVFMVSGCLMAGLAQSNTALQTCLDKRVAAFREVLYGIRIVKAYAWESAMEEKVNALRFAELRNLIRYFHYLGSFLGIFFWFPRILILSALWGYVKIYGEHNVATIFVCMQILSGLRRSCDMFISSLSHVVVVVPSVRRIESYLKLPEAPVLLPHKSPEWLELWTEERPKADGLSHVNTGDQMSLQVHGTFKWSEDGPRVLHDLELNVPRGKMVAVVGAVGSGKSTLLHAVLGELYPDLSQRVHVSRPRLIAYCSQVAHIAEGTLRDNVLFGQPLDYERYELTIEGASLKNDLAVLPGGDAVPIGSRGITLSGGQKARVALARAAYHRGSELVIIDDPFAAVDAPTAKIILEQTLLGPLMKGRTRLVTMQPDADRLQSFDHLVVMHRGRIVEQGVPADVMKTEAYKRLLSTYSQAFQGDSQLSSPQAKSIGKRLEDEDNKLREEEDEVRPAASDMLTINEMGRWRNMVSGLSLFIATIYVYLLCDVTLAKWTNSMVLDPNVDDSMYLRGYLFWLVIGLFMWGTSWFFGERFSYGLSSNLHAKVLNRLLRAPIDRFYDKHPVGRILNRMSTDMMVVDLYYYIKGSGGFAAMYQSFIPLLYIHCMMPWFIALGAVPFYYMIYLLVDRFWNTAVPLRYCHSTARSAISNLASDAAGNKVVVRAYQDQQRTTMELGDAVDGCLRANLYGDRILRRWLMNRILFMWSFLTTTLYIVGLLKVATLGAGTLGICLTNLMLLETNMDGFLDNATGAQFEIIALTRILHYLSIPVEAPMRKAGDDRYTNFTVRVPRGDLGELEYHESEGASTVEVRRGGDALLRSSTGGTTLMIADTKGSADSMPRLRDLCPSCAELGRADGWHRIVAANGAIRDARAMARELCGVTDDRFVGKLRGGEVVLEVHSGWLLEGAQVQIENIKAGYADLPRDVLKGIDLTFERKSKVAIAGTTGCGKSSLLLVLLRILELRSGRICFNGVDISSLGLATLRSAIGLVPQDPVLFSGTMRHNLDPFHKYADGRIWAALRCVHLNNLVEEWPEKLDHQISDEGGNLSFGQRQLACLARMTLRQPGLLLLDEATSAIEPHTQQLVQETIKSAFPASTLVAVAHRLETILDFDYVVVMDTGDVAEQGSVKELTERKDGVFRQMLAAKGTW